MDNENYQKLRDYALRLLSFRPRSIAEISAKLRKYCIRRNFPDALYLEVIEDLKQQKFLDDESFVRWWKQQRQSSKPKGLHAIKMELLQKGIDKDLIEPVLDEKTEEGASEYDLAIRVVNRKIDALKNLSAEKRKIKIRDMLARRGFDWETIRKVIDSWGEKE